MCVRRIARRDAHCLILLFLCEGGAYDAGTNAPQQQPAHSLLIIAAIWIFEARTSQLSQSVEEQKALMEISRVVSSSLNVEQVLSGIVRHAVQLSKTDAGTIYEFDEAEQVFMPRANYGVDEAFVEALRQSAHGVGDDTVIGRAVIKKAPQQIQVWSKKT